MHSNRDSIPRFFKDRKIERGDSDREKGGGGLIKNLAETGVHKQR